MVFAFLSSLRARFGGLVAAWLMRFSAVLNFPVTFDGMVCPAHAGLLRAAPKMQDGVVQGTVVVVVGTMFGAVVGGREVDDVVVGGGCVAVVEVVIGLVVVVLSC